MENTEQCVFRDMLSRNLRGRNVKARSRDTEQFCLAVTLYGRLVFERCLVCISATAPTVVTGFWWLFWVPRKKWRDSSPIRQRIQLSDSSPGSPAIRQLGYRQLSNTNHGDRLRAWNWTPVASCGAFAPVCLIRPTLNSARLRTDISTLTG
jgi:hypothetical protein